MNMLKLNFREFKTKAIKLELIDEDKIIGRCFIYLIRNDLHEEPYCLLVDVFIKEEFRNKGYGSYLVEKAIKITKKLGCYKIIATSRFDRDHVHRFYEKLGFKKFGYEFRMDLK